ncbi:hypothetical protein ACOMHN_045604 [Nucella lapillus]
MAFNRIILGTSAVLLLLVHQADAQAAPNPALECQQAAIALMKTCAEQGAITEANFMHFVSNGTSKSGQAPTDPAAFKDKICTAEPQIGGCIFRDMLQLANGSSCAQARPVLQRVESFLVTYDTKCAHPCRFTLVNELRECYATAGLDKGLFLSNRTSGQVIGTTVDEVTDFCSKKDPLLSCMKPIHNSCPESLPILSSVDFHLPSYEKGINILCKHPKVYLKGLECFEEPTNDVEKCVQDSQQSFLQTNVEAQTKNWTQLQFVEATCRISINQADCDLNAWMNKKHEACSKATIGLRREMECSLMPPNCTVSQKALFNKACHQDNFHKSDRDNFGKPGGSGGGGGNGAERVVSLSGSLLFALFFVAFLFPVMIRV